MPQALLHSIALKLLAAAIYFRIRSFVPHHSRCYHADGLLQWLLHLTACEHRASRQRVVCSVHQYRFDCCALVQRLVRAASPVLQSAQAGRYTHPVLLRVFAVALASLSVVFRRQKWHGASQRYATPYCRPFLPEGAYRFQCDRAHAEHAGAAHRGLLQTDPFARAGTAGVLGSSRARLNDTVPVLWWPVPPTRAFAAQSTSLAACGDHLPRARSLHGQADS